MTVDALVEAAADWVGAVHPHARHLERTREWLLVLDPDAAPALQIAALTHDVERAFPSDEPAPSSDDPASPEYNAWHQDRSARLVAEWLRAQEAPSVLVDEVAALVAAHEFGGWPAADLLQAADSLSFLEVQIDLFTDLVASGRLSAPAAERKLRFMYDRVSVARARELAAPMFGAGLDRLTAAAPQDPPSPPPTQRRSTDARICS